MGRLGRVMTMKNIGSDLGVGHPQSARFVDMSGVELREIEALRGTGDE